LPRLLHEYGALHSHEAISGAANACDQIPPWTEKAMWLAVEPVDPAQKSSARFNAVPAGGTKDSAPVPSPGVVLVNGTQTLITTPLEGVVVPGPQSVSEVEGPIF
jgi:hypothetical protein